MTIQRRFAPISGRFEPEQVAGLTGIYRRARVEQESAENGLGYKPSRPEELGHFPDPIFDADLRPVAEDALDLIE